MSLLLSHFLQKRLIIHAVQMWMQLEGYATETGILIATSERHRTIRAGMSLLSLFFRPVEIRVPFRDVKVILCALGALPNVLTRYDSAEREGASREWSLQYESGDYEVWEHVPSTKPLPLRFGLSPEEYTALGQFARIALFDRTTSDFIKAKEKWENTHRVSSAISERLMLRESVDVVVWGKGTLCGSRYVLDRPLLEAVYEAARAITHDGRFAPLETRTPEEIHIELTLIHALRIPLLSRERQKGVIDGTCAYEAVGDSARALYVPAVHNCRTFTTLDHLLTTLVHEKMPTNRVGEHPKMYTRMTEGVVLCGGESKTRAVRGTMLVPETGSLTDRERIERIFTHALAIQDEDGSFPAKISPFGHRYIGVDWIRNACLGVALARALNTFPTLKENVAYHALVERQREFLLTYLPSRHGLSAHVFGGSLLYLLDALRHTSDDRHRRTLHTLFMDTLPHVSYDPITYLRASHYLSPIAEKKEQEQARSLHGAVERDLTRRLRSHTPFDLASYADYMLQHGSTDVMQHHNDAVTRESFRGYVQSLQRRDGSFPLRKGVPFSYTRGTGKILEALSQSGLSRDDTCFIRALTWLDTLQYTRERCYFVPPEYIDRVCGGFRHDQSNATVWIDSTAHVLNALSYAADSKT
jgi:hypothetical protein